MTSWIPNQDPDLDFAFHSDKSYSKDALVFVFELTESIYTLPDAPVGPNIPLYTQSAQSTPQRPLTKLINAIYHCIFHRLLSNKDSMTSLIFVNGPGKNEPSHSPVDYTTSDYQGCHVFMDLDIPSVEKLRHLNLLTKSSQHLETVCSPIETPGSMANALHLANRMLSQPHLKSYSTKRIVLITDRDTPQDPTNQRLLIKTRVKDLTDAGVELIPYFVIPSHTLLFDPRAFYHDILSNTQSPTEPALTPHSIKDTKDLIHSFTALGTPTRPLFTNKIQLTQNLNIGVKAYSIISPKPFPAYDTVYSRVVSVSKTTIKSGPDGFADEATEIEKKKEDYILGLKARYFMLDSSTEIEKSQLLKAYKFGKDYFPFSDKQLADIRRLGDPNIRVLGFKDAAAIGWEYSMGKPICLYPSDELYTGSVRAFTALYRSLLFKNKVAMTWATFRKNSPPKIGVLVPYIPPALAPLDPQTVLDQYMHDSGFFDPLKNSNEFPMGLYFVQLAFADDLRVSPPSFSFKEPPSALVDAMRDVMERVTMKNGYIPRRYRNVPLGRFYSTLEASLFEEEIDQSIDMDLENDPTLPKYNSINARARKSIRQVNALLQECVHLDDQDRKREADPSSAANKRQKPDPQVYETVKQAWENNALGDISYQDLKEFVKLEKIKTASKTHAGISKVVARYLDAK